MKSARSRGHVAVVARVLLVATFAAALPPSIHVRAPHDTDCDPAPVFRDPWHHRIAADVAGHAADAAQHCAACHAIRLAWSSVPSRLAVRAGQKVGSSSAADAAPPRLTIVPRLPARAPPPLA